MRARTYALSLMLLAFVPFVALVGTNYVLDPQGVFGVGLFGPGRSMYNDRTLRMREFLKDPMRHDALFFTSSRGQVFSAEKVAARMQVNAVGMFVVLGANPPDYAAVLDFVLRKRRPGDRPIRKVFMLLDHDRWGDEQMNRHLYSTWPPEMTGENPIRFAWRYLTTVQFRAWSRTLRPFAPAQAEASVRPFAFAALFGVGPASAQTPVRAGEGGAAVQVAPPVREKPSLRPDYENHFIALRRVVEICRQHGIELTAVISPVRRGTLDGLDEDDLADVARRIAEIVPVWDFREANWITNQNRYWYDPVHFTAEVADFLLDRIFAGRLPEDVPEFGQVRGR